MKNLTPVLFISPNVAVRVNTLLGKCQIIDGDYA